MSKEKEVAAVGEVIPGAEQKAEEMISESKTEHVDVIQTDFEARMREILTAAEEKAQAIILAAEQKAQAMFLAKENQAPYDSNSGMVFSAFDPSMEEMVEVELFYDGDKYKDDVYVSLNGENCVIKRGIPVMIKRKFANILMQSDKQDKYAAKMRNQLAGEFQAKEKDFT